MKKFILLVVCLFGLNVFAQDAQFNLSEDLKQAMQISKNQDKPILLFFMDSKSKESMLMNEQIFSSSEFKRIAEHVILVKADKSGDNPLAKRLTAHYNKAGQYSSFVTLDYYGRVQGERVSNFDTESLTAYLNFINTL